MSQANLYSVDQPYEAKHAVSLSNWAAIGRNIREPSKIYVRWEKSSGLIVAAFKYANIKAQRLKNLIEKSEQFIYPLQEPLKTNFSLHRWLARDREEAYSDWLAWVFSELKSAERIARVLYEDLTLLPEEFLLCKEHCTSEREVWIPTGHKGRSGKLDCVLRFGKDAIIVLEVKVIGADSADTIKQAGYRQWLEEQSETIKLQPILIATSGDQQKEYEGFKLLHWRDLCKNLRNILPEIIKESRLTSAAIIAGFVSAVEQNLLGLPYLGWLDRKEDSLFVLNLKEEEISYLESIF